MALLNAKLFRDYFGGSWFCKITKNGEFNREITLNWPTPYGKFSSIGIDAGNIAPSSLGAWDDTPQVSIAGWHSDSRRWKHSWFNEFGGYGELEWTSQNEVNGITVIYGFGHESKQESDDPTEHIVKCEMFDQDHFKYTIQSFKKGLTEVLAKRIRSASELNDLLEKKHRIP